MGYRYNSEDIEVLISILGKTIQPIRKKLDNDQELTKEESRIFNLIMSMFDTMINATELDITPIKNMKYSEDEFEEQWDIFKKRVKIWNQK